jgi:hypothetical protein
LVRPMNIATVHIDDAITVEKKRAIMHEPRRVSVAGGRDNRPWNCAIA